MFSNVPKVYIYTYIDTYIMFVYSVKYNTIEKSTQKNMYNSHNHNFNQKETKIT